MFAQANSEHCRHKIFNANWVIDGVAQDRSLFAMIRHTHATTPQGTLVAYADNAAVIEGATVARFYPDANGHYAARRETTHILMKVETHNHPTAIAPFPGAATGSGGEIRDEGATGIGAKPKAGLTGFSVSHLRIPSLPQPWEAPYGKPDRIASALSIMLEGPIGGASFNNEFGRPNILGYFRTFEQAVAGEVRGYHKPIMIAGGVGNIAAAHTHKEPIPDGALLIQLGGPGMLIGMGGGAASSMATGTNTADLDFDSVQRGNAEIERRVQEVIDRCWQLGAANPILSLHDVGAGGLSNALPELVHGGGAGGTFDLRAIPSEEPGMAPREIWCNEAQERYVLAIRAADLDRFEAICARERCPCAVVGRATRQGQLVVADPHFGNRPVDMDLEVLLGKPPKMTRDVAHRPRALPALDLEGVTVKDAAYRVLQLPAVADKTFLVTIGDRTVGGLCARDQMVGPWQVPVADVAVTLMDFDRLCGRSDGDGRAHTARADRRTGVRPNERRRGDHQHRRRADCAARRHQAVGELDGAGGSSRRGRGAVRHGARRGDGTVPRAVPFHSRRQGLDVDAHDVARSRRWRPGKGGDGAAVADRVGVRAGGRCAKDADAIAPARPRRNAAAVGRSRRRAASAWRLGAGAGLWPVGRRVPRSRRPGAARRVVRYGAGAESRLTSARVSRRRRRRRVRDARGNGVRLALRTGDFRRRHSGRRARRALRRRAGCRRSGARR